MKEAFIFLSCRNLLFCVRNNSIIFRKKMILLWFTITKYIAMKPCNNVIDKQCIFVRLMSSFVCYIFIDVT